MYCPVQGKLFSYPRSPTSFGGSLNCGKRKNRRPVSLKESMHVVLRAESARGNYSLLLPQNARMTYRLMCHYGKKFEVRVYNYAFVGNHLHLLLKAKTRVGFQHFLRVFAGQVAQRITKAKPHAPLLKRFWDFIAYSRTIPWGRAYKTAQNYIRENILQGARMTRRSRLINTS